MVVPSTWKLRQKEHEFKANLSYIKRSYQKQNDMIYLENPAAKVGTTVS